MRVYPAWKFKYPCLSCPTSYVDCAEYRTLNLKCCKDCSHLKGPRPQFTEAELAEMRNEHE